LPLEEKEDLYTELKNQNNIIYVKKKKSTS
jgi:hypothetical protein